MPSEKANEMNHGMVHVSELNQRHAPIYIQKSCLRNSQLVRKIEIIASNQKALRSLCNWKSMEKAATTSTSSSSTFPYKLYATLDDKRSESSIKWLPHGRAFRIHNKEVFTTHVMPRYFKATKMRSFQRQLNLWGFKRIVSGVDTGAWWHASFVRGHPKYLESIERTEQPSRARNSLHHYNYNPDFYQMQVTSQAQQQNNYALIANQRNNQQLLQNQDTSTANNNTSAAQQAFCWPFVRRASAPPEFTQPAVSRPLPASADHSLYNAADSCLNMISTTSLHGMDTVAAYGFNDVAEEKLKQAPDGNESCSSLDEFSQFIESSIHPVPPNDSAGL